MGEQQYHFPDQPHRPRLLNLWDVLALALVLGFVIILSNTASHLTTPYEIGEAIPISLDTQQLPHYALRTVLRMFLALILSVLFSFIFGTFAAKNKHAERIIIPLVDILQSIPVLGYLSITIVTFIMLFPNSILGPELAAIFVIFTSQAWNMMLSLYQSLKTVPHNLKEAARMFHLSPWQQFWRIEVPFAMPSFLWNAMMSMSAGWFFVVASEAIPIANQKIMLPGIGSYIEMAIVNANLAAVGYAILTMLIVIFLYDQLLFRPLVAWSEKFKTGELPEDDINRSWVLILFKRTRLIQKLVLKCNHILQYFLIKLPSSLKRPRKRLQIRKQRRSARWLPWFWYSLLAVGIIYSCNELAQFIFQHLDLPELRHVFLLGCYTSLRVILLIILCSLFWVPIGVWIGLRPRVARTIQPIAQFFAAFPSNLFFPPIVSAIVIYHLNVNIWITPLMILGTQWYILFNVIAGASTIPRELLYASRNFGVKKLLWWRRLALPAIMPYFVTGALTAAGGAWNASIVAEFASWGDTTLIADGIGAYITQNTLLGDFPRVALGISIMCMFVMFFNQIFWKPLYHWSANRFSLDA